MHVHDCILLSYRSNLFLGHIQNIFCKTKHFFVAAEKFKNTIGTSKVIVLGSSKATSLVEEIAD